MTADIELRSGLGYGKPIFPHVLQHRQFEVGVISASLPFAQPSIAMKPVSRYPPRDQRAIGHAVAPGQGLIAPLTGQVILNYRVFELLCVLRHTSPKSCVQLLGVTSR